MTTAGGGTSGSMSDSSQRAAYEREIMGRLGSRNPFRKKATSAEQDEVVSEMGRNRRVNAKLARAMQKQGVNGQGGRSGADLSFATGRPRDPMFYWKQNNLPWDINDEKELQKIRAYCRILYLTHPIIASAIDIYTKYPLLGMELTCKDDKIKEFYEAHFFTKEGLNYNEFLIDFGREYWMVGEVWPFATFNEMLGVWEDEELLNPDHCDVQRSPFLKEPRFLINLPESLRELIKTQSPRWEYEKLMSLYPELQHYSSENAKMPVSNILLKQFKFKADTFHQRGIPILMRAFRAVMQEEMLNSAMDAIADRLYTPLILAKLGASATDLGTQVPWVPDPGDLEDFEEALDAALAADFRVLVHHFAIDMAPVFGRENMPDMGSDFDRLVDRILQTFGLSRTMLNGASGGETYAADALNRDLVSQLLTTFQDLVKAHFRDRALVVAEAQGHFDYEVRNGKRYVVMEEILEVDEETGEERIVEQPALLIPELVMKSMSISDEEAEKQFREALVMAGVPISIQSRLKGTDLDFEEELEKTSDENVRRIVVEQETRKKAFLALRAAGLPIPPDLAADFQPVAAQAQMPASNPMQLPMAGMDPTQTPNLNPVPGGDQMETQDPMTGANQPEGTPDDMGQGPGAQIIPMPGAQVPPESNEQRASMPKPAVLYRTAAAMRKVAKENWVDLSVQSEHEDPENRIPKGRFGNPKHVGLRRHVAYLFKDAEGNPKPIDEEDAS